VVDPDLTVAIVGGGASGTLVASELLRRAAAQRLSVHIWLIDEHGRHGAGQAYSTDNEMHLLNAPASKMSARPDEPYDLIEWARSAGAAPADVGPATFLARRVYRRYLRESLAASLRAAAPASRLRPLSASVTAIRPRLGQGGAWLEAGERWLDADAVVLAAGHAPAELPFEAPDAREVIADPWQPGGLARLEEEPAGAGPPAFVVAGTGLTMIDVAIAVTSRFPGSVVHAVSRHGLLPRAHPGDVRPLRPQASSLWLPPACRTAGPVSLTELAGQIRAAVAASPDHWHAVLESLRPHVPSLWQRMPDRDRRVFLKRLARYWEVHRHLMPPATASRAAELRQARRLVIHRGRIRGARHGARGLSVLVETDAAAVELTADWLINATGSSGDITTAPSPLLRQLLGSRLARPDSLRLGIEADVHGALLSASGLSSEFLFALGPPLRGQRYETTAIPEIRTQAAEIAAQITARFATERGRGNGRDILRTGRGQR
jgi:uncharacterized NAD(P)/FAD-binding protein YdhS